MSADDLRHRARPTATARAGGIGEHTTAARHDLTHDLAEPATVAARVPAEYRDAYLEGFARVRADRDHTALPTRSRPTRRCR